MLVLERNLAVGEETSSRNSEVVHAGLYYPPNSLKARACVAGRTALYSFADRAGVPYEKRTKLIVACEAAQVATPMQMPWPLLSTQAMAL